MAELNNLLNQIKQEKDTKIIPENIKNNTTVFDITGTFTSDATATAANILESKTAYAQGNKITGTMPNQGWISIFPNNNAVEKTEGHHNWVKVPADTEIELYRTCYPLTDLILNGQPSSVPNTYELLEYLEGTGTQFIKLPFPTLDTNISNGNYNVWLDAQFTDLLPRGSGSQYHLEGIGAMSTSAWDFSKAELYVGWKEQTVPEFYFSNCDNDDWASEVPADTQRHMFHIKSTTSSDTKGLYIDNMRVDSSGPTVSTCKYKYRYCLFGYENPSGMQLNHIKIYSCLIKKVQDDSIMYDLVPVKRKSDGVLGMYDKQGHGFYTNNGTGTFNYGRFIGEEV